MNKPRDPNPGRKNIYICDDCGDHIVTRDATEGVTPFVISCKNLYCTGKMCSSLYRVFDPDNKLRPSHEWYKPILNGAMTPAVYDHVRRGGLMLRMIATHKHKKRGSSYRVVGEVRLQVSRPELLDIKAIDHGGVLAQVDNQMFTLYQGEDGVYSARHPDEFRDGRFEEKPNAA